MHDDVCFGGIVQTRDIVVARVSAGVDRPQIVEPQHLRHEQFMLAHEGELADIALLRRRISPRRTFQIESDAHAVSLFAYLLTHIDSAESVDAALLRAVADIASSGLRGNFNFMLATAESMYVHRGGPPIGFATRADAVIVSSHAFTDEPERQLSSGALLRVDRGTAVAWRLLCGCVDTLPSGPELPFTD